MTTANFAPKQRGRLSLAACKNYAAKAIFSTHIRKPLAISITIGLLFGTIGTASAALSAVTAKTIQGTAPYIKLNGTPLTNISELLSIQIGGDTYTSDASGNMQKVGTVGTFTTPITTATLFSDVTAIVTADGAPHALSSDIPSSDQIDIDGDSPITLTGNVTATWKDQFGTTINTLTDPLRLCYSNYTLTLTAANNPSIETQYGDPRLRTYGNATALFKFSVPTTRIEPCWAKPDMTYSTGQYAGPASMWDSTRGFITQATSAPWGANFPTTGANELYFDLTFAGASSYPVWDTITPVNGISYTLTQVSNNTVRVTLKGPTATSSTKIPTAPTTTLLIKGTDTASKDLNYGFTLQHWYVNRGSTVSSAPSQQTFCTTTNSSYRLSTVGELSNASSGTWPFPSNPSGGNYYSRRIGAGLFSEWGVMGNYTGAGFINSGYWTNDTSGTRQHYVNVSNGTVILASPSIGAFGVCIYP